MADKQSWKSHQTQVSHQNKSWPLRAAAPRRGWGGAEMPDQPPCSFDQWLLLASIIHCANQWGVVILASNVWLMTSKHGSPRNSNFKATCNSNLTQAKTCNTLNDSWTSIQSKCTLQSSWEKITKYYKKLKMEWIHMLYGIPGSMTWQNHHYHLITILHVIYEDSIIILRLEMTT